MTLRKITATFVVFVALAGGLVSQTNAQPTHPPEQTQIEGFSDAATAALSRQLSGDVSRGDSPGVVALVVSRGGVLYQGAAGKLDVAHDRAMPVNAIFSIASMTKPVTSVAIIKLFEQGKLKLDGFRSAGSMSWAGVYNSGFWIDPVRHIGGAMMMQLLPFYDDGALRTLRDFEQLVYQNLR